MTDGVADRNSMSAGHVRFKSRQGRWVLLATVLATWLAAVDTSVVNVALPAIGEDLNAPFSDLQWILTGYTLTVASTMLLGGAAGDRYGRRRVLLLGVACFAAASTACALAPTSSVLIASRVLQGIGGGLLIPACLAIIQSTFHVEDRAQAIGAWAGLSGIAVGVAPSLGGWLLETGSWRSVFLINPTLAVIVVAVALRHLSETRDPKATGTLDLIGPLLAFVGLGSITYAVIAAGGGAGSPLVLTLGVGVGPVALAAFVWWERHTQHPLVPMHIFRSARFNSANLVAFTVYGAVYGFLFMLIIQLQTVVGFSPLLAGAAVLPITVIGALLSARSGKLSYDIGPRLQMTTGPLVCGAGILLTLRLDYQASFAGDVLPAMSVFALGLVIMTAPTAAAALAAVPDSHAGAASGVNNTVTRIARLLAIASLPAIVGLAGNDYADPVAFQAGYRAAVWICAAVLALASVLAALTMSNARHSPRHPVARSSPPHNSG